MSTTTTNKAVTGEGNAPRGIELREGDAVVHEDQYGTSLGIAYSDALPSAGRIQINFTLGPRSGECRWVPLEEVSLHDGEMVKCPSCSTVFQSGGQHRHAKNLKDTDKAKKAQVKRDTTKAEGRAQ